MKKIIIILVVVNTLSCKSQNRNKMNKIIKEITNELTTYKDQPIYYASINSSACSFEFLVNDMPVLSFYNRGGAAVSIPVNPQILNSGLQTFKIRLYPGHYKENNVLKQTSSLTKDTKFDLAFDLKNWNNLEEESKTIFEFSLPSIKDTLGIREFNFPDTPYFEYEGEFKAKVPYMLQGWKKSVDLSKEDRDDLEVEVVRTYKDLINKFENKDIQYITEYNKNKIVERLQSIYDTEKKDISKLIKSYSDEFEELNFHLKPLESYKLHIFGDGRAVCLLRTDLKNRGEGVVRVGYTNSDNKKRLSFYGFIFHRPTAGAPLEPIR